MNVYLNMQRHFSPPPQVPVPVTAAVPVCSQRVRNGLISDLLKLARRHEPLRKSSPGRYASEVKKDIRLYPLPRQHQQPPDDAGLLLSLLHPSG